MSLVYGYGATTKQINAARHARHMKKMYHSGKTKGGFALPAVVAGVTAAHNFLQKYKPVSLIRNFGQAHGMKLSNNLGGKILSTLGNFAINKLGYGSRFGRKNMKKNRRVVLRIS